MVPEVVGVLDARSIEKQVEEKCKADVLRIDATRMQPPSIMRREPLLTYLTAGAIPNDGVFPRAVFVQFQALPAARHDRAAKLAEHDSFLHAVVSEVGGEKYTVIYTTTPPASGFAAVEQAATDYEMDDPFASVLHTDLKRELGSGHASKSSDSDLGLFDKYEYTSPSIFMGLFVFILLFMILYVGITAVSSLQVSYFAFSKEMGPSQQKKQQQ
jgi:hypothetical protein